jgi:hypothetical protein
MVGRTTFGVLPSVDDGATWRWMCEDVLAFPQNMTVDPELALTAGGALVEGVPLPYQLGLSVSTDLGCNWSCAGGPLADRQIADIVLRPGSPHSVLALLSGTLTADGGGLPAQVARSTDDGASWTTLGTPFDASDSTLAVSSIDVSKSDAARIYVSATRGYGPMRKAALFVSADDGATWSENTITGFNPQTEGSLWIGAVDPTDADQVYLRSSGAQAFGVDATLSMNATYGDSHLYVSTDAGKTFSMPTLPFSWQILGLALSDDGSKVYVGSFGDGLYVAQKSDLATFTKTSSIHVECLATRGAELWACSDAVSGFIFGSSLDDGRCFTPRLPLLNNVTGPIECAAKPGGPLACGATSNSSICTTTAFQNLCTGPFAMDANCFTDAGPIDSGCGGGGGDGGGGGGGGSSDGGHGPAASSSKGCGCTTMGGGTAGGASGVGLLVAAAALRRRRSRLRPRRSPA